MKRGWTARRYEDGDEEGIFELHKIVYPDREYDRDKWLRWWHWLFKEGPAGEGIILVAEDGGKIVGHDADIPVLMKIGNRNVTGRLGTGTMTHPDYRRQGIYPTLNNLKQVESKRRGFYIEYNFPRAVSYRIAMKHLGTLDVGAMRVLVKPLNWENVLRMRLGHRTLVKLSAAGGRALQGVLFRPVNPPAVAGLTISRAGCFDEPINDFWATVSHKYPIMVVRNEAYLNWRYVSIPDIDYLINIARIDAEIYGYLVMRILQRQGIRLGVIFDVIARSREIVECLLSKVLNQCREEKVDLVYSRMIANRALYRAYGRSGFISVPFTRSHFLLDSTDPHVSRSFLKKSANWLVQMGDSDFI